MAVNSRTLCSPNEDFGSPNERLGTSFRSTFQASVAQIEHSHHWKILRKDVPKRSFGLLKSSFGEHKLSHKKTSDAIGWSSEFQIPNFISFIRAENPVFGTKMDIGNRGFGTLLVILTKVVRWKKSTMNSANTGRKFIHTSHGFGWTAVLLAMLKMPQQPIPLNCSQNIGRRRSELICEPTYTTLVD